MVVARASMSPVRVAEDNRWAGSGCGRSSEMKTREGEGKGRGRDRGGQSSPASRVMPARQRTAVGVGAEVEARGWEE